MSRAAPVLLISSENGFGFFGLLVFIIFMAIAGSIVMVTTESSSSTQSLQETVTKMDAIGRAITAYKANSATSAAPPTLAHLLSNVSAATCTATPASSKMVGWCGPYLGSTFNADASDLITDGWNTAFEYVQGSPTSFLYSWGPNKTDNNGGGDDLTRTF